MYVVGIAAVHDDDDDEYYYYDADDDNFKGCCHDDNDHKMSTNPILRYTYSYTRNSIINVVVVTIVSVYIPVYMKSLHKPENAVILAHATELKTITSPGKTQIKLLGLLDMS